MKCGGLNRRGNLLLCGCPHITPCGEEGLGNKTSREAYSAPGAVVFGGSVRVFSGFAGALLGWA